MSHGWPIRPCTGDHPYLHEEQALEDPTPCYTISSTYNAPYIKDHIKSPKSPHVDAYHDPISVDDLPTHLAVQFPAASSPVVKGEISFPGSAGLSSSPHPRASKICPPQLSASHIFGMDDAVSPSLSPYHEEEKMRYMLDGTKELMKFVDNTQPTPSSMTIPKGEVSKQNEKKDARGRRDNLPQGARQDITHEGVQRRDVPVKRGLVHKFANAVSYSNCDETQQAHLGINRQQLGMIGKTDANSAQPVRQKTARKSTRPSIAADKAWDSRPPLMAASKSTLRPSLSETPTGEGDVNRESTIRDSLQSDIAAVKAQIGGWDGSRESTIRDTLQSDIASVRAQIGEGDVNQESTIRDTMHSDIAVVKSQIGTRPHSAPKALPRTSALGARFREDPSSIHYPSSLNYPSSLHGFCHVSSSMLQNGDITTEGTVGLDEPQDIPIAKSTSGIRPHSAPVVRKALNDDPPSILDISYISNATEARWEGDLKARLSHSRLSSTLNDSTRSEGMSYADDIIERRKLRTWAYEKPRAPNMSRALLPPKAQVDEDVAPREAPYTQPRASNSQPTCQKQTPVLAAPESTPNTSNADTIISNPDVGCETSPEDSFPADMVMVGTLKEAELESHLLSMILNEASEIIDGVKTDIQTIQNEPILYNVDPGSQYKDSTGRGMSSAILSQMPYKTNEHKRKFGSRGLAGNRPPIFKSIRSVLGSRFRDVPSPSAPDLFAR